MGYTNISGQKRQEKAEADEAKRNKKKSWYAKGKKKKQPKPKPPYSPLILTTVTPEGEYIYWNPKEQKFEKHMEPVPGAKDGPPEMQDYVFNLAVKKGVIDEDANSGLYAQGLYTTSQFTEAAKYAKGEAKGASNDGFGPHSEVNAWSLMRYRGTPLNPIAGGKPASLKNVYKTHTLYEKDGKPLVNPTAAELIEISTSTQNSPGYHYSYKDFVPCKHYGEIPNNYLLTLRRFAAPVEDNIIAPVKYGADGKKYNTMQPAIAQAVTWMSPKLGNDLKEILKFNVGFEWETAKSEMQTIQGQSRDTGMVGGFLDAMPMSQNVQGAMKGETPDQTYRRQQGGSGWDPMKDTYPNHNLGEPLNIIKQVEVRKPGLKFSQEFSLVFKYDLKGYPYTSPKLALLDVISNMLVLTYNNAPFWGGATRYTGGGKVGKPFGDLKKLQDGDIKGFLGSVVSDLKGALTGAVDDLMKGGDSKILNSVIGGGLMKLLGGPQGGQVAAAFLTGDATGQWHLTVGNPLNPIAVIGNLGMTDADFELEGPLGFEDFPTQLKVTIKLKPARPRDKADIESMFNAGKGRLYVADNSGINVDAQMDVNAYGHQELSRPMKEKMIKQANG